MTRDEAIRLRMIVEEAVQSLSDETAVTAVTLFPHWKAGTNYIADQKVQHGDILYKCRQEHTSQEVYPPELTPAIWTAINETNKGTLKDPIPAVAGMEYKKDLYYVYNDVVYLCIRQDTESGTVLQFTPDQLVGIYFEEVTE